MNTLGPNACPYCNGYVRPTSDGPACLNCGRSMVQPVQTCALCDCPETGCEGHLTATVKRYCICEGTRVSSGT